MAYQAVLAATTAKKFGTEIKDQVVRFGANANQKAKFAPVAPRNNSI